MFKNQKLKRLREHDDELRAMVAEIENEVNSYEDEKTRLCWDDVTSARTFSTQTDSWESVACTIHDEEFKEEEVEELNPNK